MKVMVVQINILHYVHIQHINEQQYLMKILSQFIETKKYITLDKPIINGMIILELSKYLMYNFYYNTLKKRYGDKIKLLFTDTDRN